MANMRMDWTGPLKNPSYQSKPPASTPKPKEAAKPKQAAPQAQHQAKPQAAPKPGPRVGRTSPQQAAQRPPAFFGGNVSGLQVRKAERKNPFASHSNPWTSPLKATEIPRREAPIKSFFHDVFEIPRREDITRNRLAMGLSPDIQGTAHWSGQGEPIPGRERDPRQGREAAEKAAIETSWDQKASTKELTYEEFMALSPQQQAVIQLNTELVNAVIADRELATSKKPGKADDTYKTRMNTLFGKDKGSELYAPQTLNVLEKFGVPEKGDDLDDYINLNALVSDEDMKRLFDKENDKWGAVRALSPSMQRTQVMQTKAVNAMSTLLAHGETLLESAREIREGQPATPEVGFQLGSSDAMIAQRDGDLDTLFQTLMTKDDKFKPGTSQLTREGLDAVLSGMKTDYGLSNEDVAQYFERRLDEIDYGKSVGKNLSFDEWTSTDEFRANILGG